MSLTPTERRELADITRRAKELRAKKDAEKKTKAAAERKARAKALVRTPGQRQPRERDPGYLAFLRRLPCAVGIIKGDCCGGRLQRRWGLGCGSGQTCSDPSVRRRLFFGLTLPSSPRVMVE